MYERRSGKSNLGLILGIIAGVLILSVGCCGGLFWYGWSKGGFAIEPTLFVNEVSQGNVDAAYKRTSKNFQAKQSLAQFKEYVDKNPEIKGSQIQLQPVGQPNTDTGPVPLTGSMGGKKIDITAVKEDGSWKIDDFTITK